MSKPQVTFVVKSGALSEPLSKIEKSLIIATMDNYLHIAICALANSTQGKFEHLNAEQKEELCRDTKRHGDSIFLELEFTCRVVE